MSCLGPIRWSRSFARPSVPQTAMRSPIPSPVPPYLRVVDLSTCSNSAKMVPSLSLGIPIPVSTTANCSVSSVSVWFAVDFQYDFAGFRELDCIPHKVDHDLTNSTWVNPASLWEFGDRHEMPIRVLAVCRRQTLSSNHPALSRMSKVGDPVPICPLRFSKNRECR